MTFNLLNEVFKFAESPAPFNINENVKNRIASEHVHLNSLLRAGKQIYGVNTAVGHRDNLRVDSPVVLWNQVVESHLIGRGIPYCVHQTRCIGLTKLMQWQSGMSGVSPALFEYVRMVIADPEFAAWVPSGQSYSCGDVIPATHWAHAVLRGTKKIGAYSGDPETMPLINGSFVHVGLAASAVSRLDSLLNEWFATTKLLLDKGCRNNTLLFFSKISEVNNHRFLLPDIESNSIPRIGVQDAVSVRASLDVGNTLKSSFDQVCFQIESALAKPSGNPLIDCRIMAPVSQASFLEPSLTIAQSALIEALLFAMWTSVSRTQYVLSGVLPSVPVDGASRGQGIIQKPKQMLSILENARLKAGRRVFSSGGSASQGIEDLWTFGTFTSELLNELVGMFGEICRIEASIFKQVF
jgi:histidine ammonia-lyase